MKNHPGAPKSRSRRLSLKDAPVLAATDFSRLANAAIARVCRILPRGTRLHLVNVQHPRALAHGDYRIGPWSIAAFAAHQHYLERCRRRLEALAGKLGRTHAHRITGELIVDWKVASAICAAARRIDAVLICIGSHGHTGLKSVLLGSVAQGVFSQARQPVLVVPQR
jgi:nucleotide-binding universal stress UspA family protein